MEGEAENIESVLFSKDEIRQAIDGLGAKLAKDYRDRSPVVLTTLKGACLFFADLVRAVQPCPKRLEIDFLTVQSYGAAQELSGTINVDHWCTVDLTNRHIILVDDICDTGHTLNYLLNALRPKCASIVSVVLLDKAARRTADVSPTYSCFTCPDLFVVGYGMDYQQRYRTLPFIGVLKQSAIDCSQTEADQ